MMEIPELTKRIDTLYNKGLFTELAPEEQTELDELNKEFNAKLMDLVMNQKQVRDEKSREMKNRRRRGKAGERKVAKLLDQKREGGVGMRDTGDSMYSTEVKTVKRIPASIEKLLSQSRRLAKQGTIAIGAFRCGRRVVVVFEGEDFADVTGEKIK